MSYRYSCLSWKLASKANMPLIPGHEGVVVVAKVGAGITHLKFDTIY